MVMNDLESLSMDDGDDYVEDNNGGKSLKGKISYCLDCHAPQSSPGLGDRSKDTVLLYRCEDRYIYTYMYIYI
jgi:hypothetical protein